MSIPDYSPAEHIRNTQARNSSYRLPPFDGSIDTAEIFDWHAQNNADYPLYVFDKGDGTGLRKVTLGETANATHVAAKHIRNIMGWTPGSRSSPVVAMLGPTDVPSYFTILSAIIRAGYAVFPLSPRNSPAAVAHLVSKVQIQHIFIGREPAWTNLTNAAFELLPASERKPTVSPFLLFEEMFDQPKVNPEDVVYEKRGPDDVILYLHSSGSTSFPKPIPQTERRWWEVALASDFGYSDMTGKVWATQAAPTFHALGFFNMQAIILNGIIVSVFKPQSPAPIYTVQAHFEAAKATNAEVIYGVSFAIEGWAANEEYVKWLVEGNRRIIFGGGGLSKSVGDFLSSKGIIVTNLYGTTEVGPMSIMFPPASYGQDWEYFEWTKAVVPELVPLGDGTYEVVIVSAPYNTNLVPNTTVRGHQAYATADVAVHHPTKHHLWKVVGRRDDQIVHSTGEKTNPSPLEDMFNRDPHIKAGIVFGTGRFQTGLLVEPKPEYAFDPSDEAKVAEFRNLIAPTIKKVNEFAPQHSRIFKEMVLIAKPSKPFTFTAKGTVRRQATIKDYDEEINQIYEAVASSSEIAFDFPTERGFAPLLEFVRNVVIHTTGVNVGDDDDLFQHGLDSLQATYIRNILLKALRESAKVDTKGLDENLVYTFPTISLLTGAVLGTIENTGGAGDDFSKHVEEMLQLVDKYSQFTTSTVAQELPASSKSVVFITGTTGGIGSTVLEQLLLNENVARVYAYNRKSTSATDRLKGAFEDRGLDVAALESSLSSKRLIVLEGDVTTPDLGLSKEVLAEIQSSVTKIIHNAWAVDFRMALRSFEPNIKGLANLIQFSLNSKFRPTLLFASTFATVQNAPKGTEPLKEISYPPDYALGTGYTESKWVVEEILNRAAKSVNLSSITVRIGQVSGGGNGSWNAKEWFPSIVLSARSIGALPTSEKTANWIPLDLVAKAIADFSQQTIKGNEIVFLVHPKPTKFSGIISTISKELGLDALPYDQWFGKLDALSRNPSVNLQAVPALKLLGFFERMVESDKIQNTDMTGIRFVATENAQKLSKTLDDPNLSPITSSQVLAWLSYWKVLA